MPVFLVSLTRTIRHSGYAEADTAADAAKQFADRIRASPDNQIDSDFITDVSASLDPEADAPE